MFVDDALLAKKLRKKEGQKAVATEEVSEVSKLLNAAKLSAVEGMNTVKDKKPDGPAEKDFPRQSKLLDQDKDYRDLILKVG